MAHTNLNMKAKRERLKSDSNSESDEFAKIDQIIADGFAMDLPSVRPESVAEIRQKMETANKISEAAFEAIRNNKTPYYFNGQISNKIIRLIGEFGFDYADAEITFRNLDLMLEDELNNVPEDDQNRRFLFQALSHLNFVAVDYFEKELVKEFENTHIAEILVRCEATLESLDHSEKFFKQAVLSIKESTEKTIERQKKQAEIREAIKMFDDPEDERFQTEYSQHPEIKLDRAIFLLNYVVPGFADADNTEKAKFIKFLTGLGGKTADGEYARQRFSSINEKPSKSEKAFKKDIGVIRGFIKSLNLSEALEKLDNDMNFN